MSNKAITLRAAPTASDGDLQVDREAGVIRGVSVIESGPALGHGFDIDDVTLDQTVELMASHPAGVKVRLAHPNACDDGTGRELGRVSNGRRDGERVLGDLHVLDAARRAPDGNLADWLLDVAEEDPALIGLSIHARGEAEKRLDEAGEPRVGHDGDPLPPVLRLDALLGVDVVDEPAANRSGLFASAAAATTYLDQVIPPDLDAEIIDVDHLVDFGSRSDNLVALARNRAEDIRLGSPDELDRAAHFLNRYLDRRGLDHPAFNAGDVAAIVHRLQEPRTMDHDTTALDSAAADDQATALTGIPPTPPTDPALLAKATREENQRIRDIEALGAAFPGVDLSETVEACKLDTNVTLADAREAVLAKLATTQGQGNIGKAEPVIGEDAAEKLHAQAVDALILNRGLKLDSVDDVTVEEASRRERVARDVRGLGPKKLAALCLRQAGVGNVERMSDDEVFNRSFGPFALSSGVGHTTGDFPLILADAANKTMIGGYNLAPVTWDMWCRIGSLSDFKVANRLRLSESPLLDVRVEGDPTPHGTFDEQREQITLGTYDKSFSYTRQMFVNDDVGAFMDLAQRFGAGANFSVEVLVYTSLTSNTLVGPTMSDSNALFHTDHGNLGSSNGVPSQANIERIAAAMMEQAGIGQDGASVTVGAPPRYWIAAPTTAFTIEKIVNSDFAGSDARRDRQLAMIGAGQAIPVPILTGLGAGVNYYAVADQNLAPSYEVAFLNGNRTPTIVTQNNPSVDGTTIIVRNDYATFPTGGWQGIYRDTGAA